jgi:hypothetical protein
MIVLIIDGEGVTILERKSNAPVTIDVNRPASWIISNQFMEIEARRIHIVNVNGRIQSIKYQHNLVDMLTV